MQIPPSMNSGALPKFWMWNSKIPLSCPPQLECCRDGVSKPCDPFLEQGGILSHPYDSYRTPSVSRSLRLSRLPPLSYDAGSGIPSLLRPLRSGSELELLPGSDGCRHPLRVPFQRGFSQPAGLSSVNEVSAPVFLYLPIESERTSPYTGPYRIFGLQVCNIRDGVNEEIIFLPDISTDASFVLRLVEIFNRKQLDPIHLMDVMEDLL